MRKLSLRKAALFSSWLAVGGPSLSACDHKAEPAKADVSASKAAATRSLSELSTQVEVVQKAVSDAHGRVKALPEDLRGLEPIRSQLLSIEEVQGVEEARVKWIAGEIETATAAGNHENLEKMAETAKGAVAGSKGVEKSVAELADKLIPFELRVAQIQAIGAKGDVFKAGLPSGTEVFGAKGGLENQLIAFIDDDKRRVDKKTWFEFDRIGFAGTGAVVPEASRFQLENVASILLAYPRVKLALASYSNAGGSPEEKALAPARAESVKAALLTRGIAAERLSLDGHGPPPPSCHKGNQDCQTRGQRILAQVTAK
ncbi:MAG TPA: OmpA family protein [Polyangia bacterium]|jgi:outer membrane protein OmpA-like peptidoglycan-associated protein|nr:OmpA family protein [Polyangia bacterium]